MNAPPPPNTPQQGVQHQSAVASTSTNTGLSRWLGGWRGLLLAVAAVSLGVGWYNRGGEESEERGIRGTRVAQTVPYPKQAAPPPPEQPASAPAQDRQAPPPPPPPNAPAVDIPEKAYQASSRVPLRQTRPNTNERPAGTDPADPASALNLRLKATKLEPRQATRVTDPHWSVRPGTSIPCTLDTALDSTYEGQAVCWTSRDIWCSTGHNICLDRDTEIVMQVKADDMDVGRERLFIVAATATTPDHITIDLESTVTDGQGRVGVGGQVDYKRGERLWNALAVGLAGTGGAYAQRGLGMVDVPGSPSAMASRTLQQSFRPGTRVPPVLRKWHGEIVHINVDRWLNFAPAYEVRPR